MQCNWPENGVPVKAWTKGVPLEDAARKQLLNAVQLPFVFKWIAATPDVHWGVGATVGSLIPTKVAIIPAAVGVNIGCGMMAVQTSLNARDLPDNLKGIRAAIEKAVPMGGPITAAPAIAAPGTTSPSATRKFGWAS
jgi:tRNA-splicing ligase RtcB (3'-phosphate/5'-hydroxy nucleic acid ligase)